MLGQTATYARLPYFLTDKHNLGMEYTGYTAPQADHDLVIRGDLATREFIALWLRQHMGNERADQELIGSGQQIDASRMIDVDSHDHHA